MSLVALARRYERETGDFSAVLTVSMRDTARGQSYTARGAVAVRRPDAMRMQMTGPGGITALDLIARDGDYWAAIAGRPWQRGHLGDEAPTGFPAGTIARIFLGLDWTRATVVSDGPLAVVRAPSGRDEALITFETHDGTTREVRWFVAGDERARVRFVDFVRASNGARFPRTVLFWQSHPDASATITAEQWRLSPTLPERTFTAP